MPRGVSAVDEARLQGRLWTPDMSGVDVWWSAADGQTSVATWPARRGGSALTLTGSGAALTRYGAAPARSISGVSGYYTGSASLSGLSGATIFVFGSVNDRGASANNGALSYAQGASTFNNDILFGAAGGTALLQFNSGADGSLSETGVRAYSGGMFLRFDGAAPASDRVQLLVNGARRGALGYTPPTTLSAGMDTLVLGRYAPIVSDTSWAGDLTLAHLIIWRRALAPWEMDRTLAWAAWEAGLPAALLPASHPYRARPPLLGT